MNRYKKIGNKYLVQIYGTEKECFFWIDKDDYRKINKVSWYYQHGKGDYGAIRGNIGKKKIFLHRYIMNCDTNDIVDHLNRNTLDNCKKNLRIVDIVESNRNRRVPKNSKSGVRGIKFAKNKWEVGIWAGGKTVYLGRYEDLEEAKEVYRKKSLELFGKIYE